MINYVFVTSLCAGDKLTDRQVKELSEGLDELYTKQHDDLLDSEWFDAAQANTLWGYFILAMAILNGVRASQALNLEEES